MPTEHTPLLWADAERDRHVTTFQPSDSSRTYGSGNDQHTQFCALVGVPSTDLAADTKFRVSKKSLYGRVLQELSSQRHAYGFSAALSNTLLLSQVVLGAALTGLGASASSHILITIFGALNTVIAGLVAYLKSRGQPMRARMYRDDLERVMDEIQNSEVMWRGISQGAHGYDDIDTDEVTVRSEVARLTRLFEKAVRNNTMNNPDMYMAGAMDSSGPGLRKSGVGPAIPNPAVSLPAVMPNAAQGQAIAATPAPVSDPDQSPASAPPKKTEDKQDAKNDSKRKNSKDTDNDTDKDTDGKGTDKGPGKTADKSKSSGDDDKAKDKATTSAPAQAQATQASSSALPQPQQTDPDESPAIAAHIQKSTTNDHAQVGEPSRKDDAPKKVKGDDDE